MKKFAERLVSLRQAKGLTQVELAELLNISRGALSLYELGRREPDFETASKIADFFGVSVDYLLGRTDDPRTLDQITAEAEKKIDEALEGDEELMAFWQELKKRDDLQLLFKQVRPLSPKAIRRIMAVIKAIEDAEAMED